MTVDPKSFNMPETSALNADQLDNLGRAILGLTKEVCVLADRVCVMEHILAEKGVDVTDAIDRHQPDAALQARVDSLTAKIVGGIVAALQGD
jgi:hypothetical protein